jgi:hypothetical protein
LPPLAPPSGFSGRVLARVKVTAPRRAKGWLPMAWARAGVIALGLGIGWALLWLPPVVGAARDLWSPVDLFEQMTRALLTLHLWLGPVFGAMRDFAVLWASLAAPLASAPFLVVAVACLLVSAAAFRALRRLVLSNRRWVYADPI